VAVFAAAVLAACFSAFSAALLPAFSAAFF
jgi:hypothetical protein